MLKLIYRIEEGRKTEKIAETYLCEDDIQLTA